jgi:hypothetical protein
MMLTVLRLLMLFLLGLTAWGLTFGRSLAWHGQRRGLLICVVMADEMIGIFAGMFLARHGTYVEGVACALGGAVAAWLLMSRSTTGSGGTTSPTHE